MSSYIKALTSAKDLAVDPGTMNTLATIADPYFDKVLRATGYPDGTSTISSLQHFSPRTTVVCPFTLAAGQTWSFHIFTTPLHRAVLLRIGTQKGNYINYSTTQDTFGPVMIHYRLHDAAGTVIQSKFTVLDIQGGGSPSVPTNTQTRTVSLGFELHNTTPEIYQQGFVTVYRSNAGVQSFNGYLKPVADPVANAIPHSSTYLCSYPRSIREANQYPGTRTWEASKGAYMVALPTPENPYGQSNGSNFAILNIDDLGALAMRTVSAFDATATVTYSPLSNVGVFSSQFTDANQTFSLDARQCLENIPDPNDIYGLSFAAAAPEFNKLFIELYRRMFNSMPPGVPVGFNSAGEWFRRVWGIAKSILPDLINLLPPAPRAVGHALLPIGVKVVDELSKSRKKDKNSVADTRDQAQIKGQRMLPANRQ